MNLSLNTKIGGGVGMMKTVSSERSATPNTLFAAVSGFSNGASPSTVRASVLEKLDQFSSAPAAKESLQRACNPMGGNMLHHVANFEQTGSFVHKLVDLGVDVNAKNRAGVTPLFFAVAQKNSCPEFVATFLSAGADPNAQNPNTGNPVVVEAVLTKAPVENLRILLEDPNLEIPEKVSLPGGVTMDFSKLLEKTYKNPDEKQCLDTVLMQRDGVSRNG